MLYIGKNEDSDLLVGITKNRKLFHVSESDKNTMSIGELEKAYSEKHGEDCEVVPNFTFTATIVPTEIISTDTGKHGGVLFVDYDDPRIEYVISQTSLLELLQCIASNEVETVPVGFHGLFTFGAAYGKFTTRVYRG